MTTTMKQDTEEFLEFAAAAVDLPSVHYLPDSGMLSVIRSVRDLDNKGRQKYLYHMPLSANGNGVSGIPPSLLDPSIQIRIPSPSGKRTLIVKERAEKTATTTKSLEMEIWQGDALTKRIMISSKVHGPIINDPTGFGIPMWSPDEKCILYSAERKAIPTKAFWDKEEEEKKPGDVDDEESEVIRGGQNVLGQGTVEDWGEKLSKQSPLLDMYILCVETGKFERVKNVPEPNVTLGQAVWHPSGQRIAYTGWDAGGFGSMARRLGMIFCKNRPSKIFASSIVKLLDRVKSTGKAAKKLNGDDLDSEDDECICITPDFVYARSPQPVETGDARQPTLVFLARRKGFVSHDGCMSLCQLDGQDLDCIVPVVDVPRKGPPELHGMGFPGLYLDQLPPACGCGHKYIVTTTLWGSFQRVIRIDLRDGSVSLVQVQGTSPLASHKLLCRVSNHGDGWIISEVSSNRPAKLWHIQGVLNPAQNGIVHARSEMVYEFSSMAAATYSTNIQPKFKVPVDLNVYSVPPAEVEGVKASKTDLQALVMIPRKKSNGSKFPVIVVPHGGPHSCTFSNYAPGFAYLASHYILVFPNYRGSTGFGQTSLNSLLKNIGTVDVEDVMACTRFVITSEDLADRIDKTKVGICGGSHGGFLTAHCTGQYPEHFSAAVMRNPVTNIASMVTATDIADWCYAEALGTYDASTFRGPTLEEMTTMYEKSPIVHVGNVVTPTLIALGMSDLRVPPSQGKEWYHTLRAAGVDTKLLVYPDDCHALDQVTTEADHWIHIKQWCDKYFDENALDI